MEATLNSLLEQVDLLKSATHVISLSTKISQLETELSNSDEKLTCALSQVQRLQKLYDKSQNYNLELRKQMATFSIELMQYKQMRASEGQVTFADVSVQTEEVALVEDQVVAPAAEVTPPEDVAMSAAEHPDEAVSLADSLKMAAESVVEQSGFTFDEATGMYYDYNSGYYYDSEKCLYYEPNSGVYYEFNSDTQQYVYHSQVDLSELKKEMRREGRIRVREENIEKKREEKWEKKEKREERDSRRAPREDERSDSRRRDDERDTRRPRDEGERRKERGRGRRSSSRERDRKRHKRDRSEDRDRKHRRRDDRRDRRDNSVEDGEVSSDSAKDEEEKVNEELAAQYLPSVRAIVTKSNCLDVGHWFIMTCTGATIGRSPDLSHAVVLNDPEVNKMHCRVEYDPEMQRFKITDQASSKGTFVNGDRIGEAKEVSLPKTIYNEDKLQIGDTHFDLHIHRGTATCEGCEPSLLQSKVAAEKRAEAMALTRETDRRQQLKQIKKRYGLKDAEYEDDSGALNNPKYEDKAAERRRTKGSDNPHQKEEAPASVHRAISTENKGHKMLAKMGWKEGQSLGKTEHSGITEPVQVNQRAKATAGLGAFSAFESSMSASTTDVKQMERLLKTQERYKKIEQAEKSNKDSE